MTTERAVSPQNNGSLPDAPTAATKHTYKSWKKKYAKLKVKLDRTMRENNELFAEEMRIQDLSKRIKEQNDQMMDLLLEFNENLHIPPGLRYDVDPTTTKDDTPYQEDSSYKLSAAQSALLEAKNELRSGEITLDTYRQLEESMLRSKQFAPKGHLPTLLQTPHTEPSQASTKADGAEEKSVDEILGFMTAEQEIDYLASADSRIGDPSTAAQQALITDKTSPVDREREAALRNPVSVYNWLRQHQPQVFLQDAEVTSEKSTTRPSNSRPSKRGAASAHARKEEDYYDEDGIALDVGAGGSRGKRKRDEDGGYRPKGGSGGVSKKKKKEKDDSSYSGKRTKKSSIGGSG